MSNIGKYKRVGKKPLPRIARDQIFDVRIEDHALSIRKPAGRVKMKSVTVHKTVCLSKAEKLDRGGLEYERLVY